MIAIFCALPSEYLNLIRFIRKKINCTAIKIISDFANEASAGTLNQNTLCSHQTAGGIYRSHDHKPDFI